ncbi:hypothetical protein CsSME_00002514 [Camellia sinensis var. sinensis]
MGVWSSSLAEEGHRHSLFSTSSSVRDHGGLSDDDDDDDDDERPEDLLDSSSESVVHRIRRRSHRYRLVDI